MVPAQLDLTHAVMVGRQDFTVRSSDAVLGHEKWNVTYAQLDILAPPLAAGTAAPHCHLPQIDAINTGVTLLLPCAMYSRSNN